MTEDRWARCVHCGKPIRLAFTTGTGEEVWDHGPAEGNHTVCNWTEAMANPGHGPTTSATPPTAPLPTDTVNIDPAGQIVSIESTVEAQDWSLEITDGGDRWLHLTLDGTVTTGPGVDMNDMARRFWTAVTQLAPLPKLPPLHCGRRFAHAPHDDCAGRFSSQVPAPLESGQLWRTDTCSGYAGMGLYLEAGDEPDGPLSFVAEEGEYGYEVTVPAAIELIEALVGWLQTRLPADG